MSTRGHILVMVVTLSSVLFMLRLVRRNQMRAQYSLLWLSADLPHLMLALQSNFSFGQVTLKLKEISTPERP